jgi:hypothetical protein
MNKPRTPARIAPWRRYSAALSCAARASIRRTVAGTLATTTLTLASAVAHGEPLLACGSSEVRIYEVDGDRARLTWTWSAHDDHGLPDAFKTGLLDKIDECKPVLGSTAVLVTASTDGVALIDIRSGKALFWARVAMAHSADVLPGRRIAVAASLAAQGNRLEIYDIDRPDRLRQAGELYSGHGVVWDERRSRLFALGMDAVRAYVLEDWNGAQPRLRLVDSFPLPGKADGHDLSPLAGTGEFIVSASDGVWRFDPDTRRYAPYEPLADLHNVKAVSVEPRTGRIAFQQPEESWWSHHVRLLAPAGSFEIRDMRVYKVRWLSDDSLQPIERP